MGQESDDVSVTGRRRDSADSILIILLSHFSLV